jgi:uncharacterized protein
VGLVSGLLGRVVGLAEPVTGRISVDRDVEVRLTDGVILRGDHYAPALAGAPTVLIRTPYGKRGNVALMARAAAGQGFHVLVQCCRGTYESTGHFAPMRHEREDGLATLAWLRAQPWYSGELCTFGPSYVGFTQWAIAADAGTELKAMATVVTASQFRDSTYAGGAFSLDSVLTWAELLAAQEEPRWSRRVELWKGQPRLHRGLAHLPLLEADAVATGAEVAFVREWLRHDDPGDPYWDELGHRHRIGEVGAAVLMIGGWQDIFLPWQLADYEALRASGRRPALTIGPWHHGSVGLHLSALREAMAWFKAHTSGGASAVSGASAPGEASTLGGASAGEAGLGSPASPRARPVRLHVGGAGGGWRGFVTWPPPSVPTSWFLHPAGGLADRPPATDREAGAFRYDPADPTPAVGGPRLVGKVAGVRDNRALEARPDVLTYTTAPLPAALEIIGPVSARVFLGSDLGYFDVFIRLCDVDTVGRSWNVCDGLARVSSGVAGDEVHEIEVSLWPAAHRFGPGHRIRLQISGGAHPRFARNTGSGEALGAATHLRAGWRRVLAGPSLPSAVILPVTGPVA